MPMSIVNEPRRSAYRSPMRLTRYKPTSAPSTSMTS
jgi:hypothetical protein